MPTGTTANTVVNMTPMAAIETETSHDKSLMKLSPHALWLLSTYYILPDLNVKIILEHEL
jgi:hypothetical protein